jgi:FkbH-like protein
MVLSLDDISVFTANWQPKQDNLRDIAATLNLGLDSMVFLDDSPVERGLVRRLLPEVEVLELPSDPALYVESLDRSLCFETASLTEEDRRRTASYKENISRLEFQSENTSIDDFLANLQMRVVLRPLDEANLPRIVQLINKTNQFNLTTRRLTAPEVNSLITKAGCYTQYMRLSDRFGDNGISGVLIACDEDDSLRIDNWLISCRVLGRRVEDAMLSAVLRYARSRSLVYVVGEYVPTEKNGQVRDVYEKFGFERCSCDGKGRIVFRYALHQAECALPTWLEVDDQTQEQLPPAAVPALQSK